jgi:hypothetical protein
MLRQGRIEIAIASDSLGAEHLREGIRGREVTEAGDVGDLV